MQAQEQGGVAHFTGKHFAEINDDIIQNVQKKQLEQKTVREQI